MIQTLTSIRFFAAALVFVSHLFLFNYFVGLTHGPLYEFLDALGAMGVSFFFTLSGFVLLVNYFPKLGKAFRWKDFYIARFARIYPAFFVTMLLAVPIELVSERKSYFIASFLSNLFLVQCYHPLTCGTLNSPSWSISSELTFYLLFPVLGMLFLRKPFRHLGWAILLFACYLWGIISLSPEGFYANNGFPLNRVGEFLLGMASGYLYLQGVTNASVDRFLSQPKNRLLLQTTLLLAVLVMLAQPIVMSTLPMLHPIFFLFYLLPSVVIITTLAFLERAQHAPRFLLNPWVILGGEISYSFYLLHHLVMRYSWHLLRLVFHVDVHHISLFPGILLSLCMFAVSLGGAYALYRWVEKPARRKIIEIFPKNTKTKVTPAALQYS